MNSLQASDIANWSLFVPMDLQYLLFASSTLLRISGSELPKNGLLELELAAIALQGNVHAISDTSINNLPIMG